MSTIEVIQGGDSVIVIQDDGISGGNGDGEEAPPAQGTFTPEIAFGGVSLGVTYLTQIGRYTRIGQLIFFEITLTLTAKGVSTGNVTFTGLPFPVATQGWNVANIWTDNINQGGLTTFYQPRIEPGTNQIPLYYNTNGVSQPLTNSNINNNSNFVVSGFYSTTE